MGDRFVICYISQGLFAFWHWLYLNITHYVFISIYPLYDGNPIKCQVYYWFLHSMFNGKVGDDLDPGGPT